MTTHTELVAMLENSDPRFYRELEQWAAGNEEVAHLHADDDSDLLIEKFLDDAAWHERIEFQDGTTAKVDHSGILRDVTPEMVRQAAWGIVLAILTAAFIAAPWLADDSDISWGDRQVVAQEAR